MAIFIISVRNQQEEPFTAKSVDGCAGWYSPASLVCTCPEFPQPGPHPKGRRTTCSPACPVQLQTPAQGLPFVARTPRLPSSTTPELHPKGQLRTELVRADNQRDILFLLANVLWKFGVFAQGTIRNVGGGTEISSAQPQPECERPPGRPPPAGEGGTATALIKTPAPRLRCIPINTMLSVQTNSKLKPCTGFCSQR